MTTAYLSLGSNLGDRSANLQAAVERLRDERVLVRRVSSVYETAPQYLTEQPWFLNIAVEAETSLTPAELLARGNQVEADLGRERVVRNGPRIIDVDILLYGDTVLDTPDLRIPHPGLHERRFVLEPLAELAADLVHPVIGRTIASLLQSVLDQGVRLYRDS